MTRTPSNQKNDRDHDYFFVSIAILHDKRLTLTDRGLMVCMLSLPDDWKFSESKLSSTFGIGRSQLRSSLKRLETYGYLERRNQRRDPVTKRFIPGEFDIYEDPQMNPRVKTMERDA